MQIYSSPKCTENVDVLCALGNPFLGLIRHFGLSKKTKKLRDLLLYVFSHHQDLHKSVLLPASFFLILFIFGLERHLIESLCQKESESKGGKWHWRAALIAQEMQS